MIDGPIDSAFAPVELGFKSLLPSHMANLAYRAGRKIVWDAKAQKVI